MRNRLIRRTVADCAIRTACAHLASQGGRRQLDPSTTVKRPRFRSRDQLIGERRLVVDRGSNWQYRGTRHIEDRRGRARHDFGAARRDFELLDIPAKSTANEAGRHALFQ